MESFKTATYAIDLHRNLQEIAKRSLFTAFFLCVPSIGSKIKISFTQIKRQAFKQVKKKGLNRFGTSDHWSQSCAKTSPQKPCCRCNDEEEDGASTQRPCNYDRLVGAGPCLLLVCSKHRIKNQNLLYANQATSFQASKEKRPEPLWNVVCHHWSQSCAKMLGRTSPQKPCCRCNDEEEDGASTQRPCNYDRLVGAGRA